MTWYVEKTGPYQNIIIDEETGDNIAVVYDAKNANILAAAPDLLKALKACRAYMLGDATELDLVETDRLAEQAIQKMEGVY